MRMHRLQELRLMRDCNTLPQGYYKNQGQECFGKMSRKDNYERCNKQENMQSEFQPRRLLKNANGSERRECLWATRTRRDDERVLLIGGLAYL